jgi:hypothetical protein
MQKIKESTWFRIGPTKIGAMKDTTSSENPITSAPRRKKNAHQHAPGSIWLALKNIVWVWHGDP